MSLKKRMMALVLTVCLCAGGTVAHAQGGKQPQVSAGVDSSAVIDDEGNLWTWGYNPRGQLGHGTNTRVVNPKMVMKNVASVSFGGDCMMVVDSSGTLWGAGGNLYGMLLETVPAGPKGDGQLSGDFILSSNLPPDSESTPTLQKLMTEVAQVSAGSGNVLVLKKDGSVWSWGSNSKGQLGDGTQGGFSTKPVQVLSGAVSVCTGIQASYAVKKDGSLWFWGAENYTSDAQSALTPKKIMDGVQDVALGEARILVLKADGAVWSWGKRVQGEPGYEKTNPYAEPQQVFEGAAEIAANRRVYAALSKTGELYMWGANGYGSVGTGEVTESYYEPVKVIDRVAQVEIGYKHVLAVRANGEIYAWGRNNKEVFPFAEEVVIAQPALLQYREGKLDTSRDVAPAVNTAKPTAPAWVKAEEYKVFEGDSLYTCSDWDTVLRFRDEVRQTGKVSDEMNAFYTSATKASDKDPAVYFEMGLIFEEVARRSGADEMNPGSGMVRAFSSCLAREKAKYGTSSCQPLMWQERGMFIQKYGRLSSFQHRARTGFTTEEASYIELLRHPDFNKTAYFDHPFFDEAKKTAEWPLYADQIAILIEEHMVKGDASPEIKNQRTMVPIRLVAENMMTIVDWDAATSTVTLTHAGDTIKVTLGSTTAYKNGVALTLDAAPYAKNNRTYVPLRFVSEQLGQLVEWYPGGVVSICEDRTLYDSTNVDEWMRAMNSGFVGRNLAASALDFGVFDRWVVKDWDAQRASLETNWGVSSRADLLALIKDFTENGGHNSQYMREVADVKAMNAAQRKQLESTMVDSHMFRQFETWDKKWGDKGVVAWDLCRISMLAQWGYQDGYLTAAEAITLATPAVETFKATFSGWDEGIGNYLDGYAWWSRTDISREKSEYQDRVSGYQRMKTKHAALLSDELFSTPLVPLKGITYQSVLQQP